MADSKEQTIADAVIARMQTILTTNGYATNIGTTVEDSRPNWDQDDDLPATSVFTGTTKVEPNADNERFCIRLMPVMIKVFFERLATPTLTAQFARKAIKDVIKAVGTDQTFGNVVLMTRPGDHGMEFAENTFEITGAQIEIEVAYHSQKFNLEA